MVPVEERLEFLLSFALANLLWIAFLEEFGSYFEQPFWVDGTYFAHVLFCSLHQLMVNHPLRTLVEQARTWMDEHLLVVADGLIPFCRVLASTMVEESGADRLANLGIVLQLLGAARDYWQPKPIHDRD